MSHAVAQSGDWVNFGRYAEANDAVRQAQAPAVVFMGNSITEVWNNTHPEFFTSNNYLSRGISGQVSSQMLLRFRSDVLALHPRVVVICGGTNDIAQNTGYVSIPHVVENISSMVDLARANGIVPILCSALPAKEFGWRKELEPAPQIVEFNALIRAYAKEHKILYVDYYSSLADPEGGMIEAYAYDGVHPTSEGLDVMEGIVKPVIEKALKESKHHRTH